MLHPSLRGARACVFDAGGTLIHPDWPRLAGLVADLAGRTFGADEMRRAMSEVLKAAGSEVRKSGAPLTDERTRHWVFRRVYLALGMGEEACARAVGRLDAAHDERHLWCGLDAEAPRVVEGLKCEGLLTAVISNTEDGRLGDALQAAGIASSFGLLLDSQLVGCRKPDAAIFRLALERLGVEAGEAAFVGDSYESDALAARAVGMRAVLLDPLGLHPESVCPRIRSLGELLGDARNSTAAS